MKNKSNSYFRPRNNINTARLQLLGEMQLKHKRHIISRPLSVCARQMNSVCLDGRFNGDAVTIITFIYNQ